MIITTSMLRKIKACKHGIKQFSTTFPDGKADTMSFPDVLKAVKSGVDMSYLFIKYDWDWYSGNSKERKIHYNTRPLRDTIASHESYRRRFAVSIFQAYIERDEILSFKINEDIKEVERLRSMRRVTKRMFLAVSRGNQIYTNLMFSSDYRKGFVIPDNYADLTQRAANVLYDVVNYIDEQEGEKIMEIKEIYSGEFNSAIAYLDDQYSKNKISRKVYGELKETAYRNYVGAMNFFVWKSINALWSKAKKIEHAYYQSQKTEKREE
jgi:hypothetical protein